MGLRIGFLLSIIILSSFCINAEIEPKYYIEWQQQASENIEIRVTKASKGFAPFMSNVGITVKAEVLAVKKSDSGLKVGDSILITYDHFRPKKDWVGPRPIPILKKGSSYPAYLHKSKEADEYLPAARGYSFETLNSEQVEYGT